MVDGPEDDRAWDDPRFRSRERICSLTLSLSLFLSRRCGRYVAFSALHHIMYVTRTIPPYKPYDGSSSNRFVPASLCFLSLSAGHGRSVHSITPHFADRELNSVTYYLALYSVFLFRERARSPSIRARSRVPWFIASHRHRERINVASCAREREQIKIATEAISARGTCVTNQREREEKERETGKLAAALRG